MRDGRRKNKEQIDDINQQLKSISSYRGIAAMNPWEMQVSTTSVRWRPLYTEQIPMVYARLHNSPAQRKTEYATAFLKHSSPEERKRILELVPRSQRPFYQARWGGKSTRA